MKPETLSIIFEKCFLAILDKTIPLGELKMKFEEIEKLCNEAMPGPWHFNEADRVICNFNFANFNIARIPHRNFDCPISHSQFIGNGKFMAASRELIPKLLGVAKAAQNAFDGMLCDDSSFIEGAPLDGCKCCLLDKALKDLERDQ